MRSVNELERLATLHDLQIADAAPEPHFDAICELARDLFQVPVALVTFIDADRQWFKGKWGTQLGGTSREAAFCRFTILDDDILVIEDATKDPRCATNLFVTREPGLRFYAGAPLIFGSGLRLGTLCLLDYEPRTFTTAERASLKRLADIVVAQVHLHKANLRIESEFKKRQAREATIEAQAAALRRREAMLAQTEKLANLGTWEIDLDTREMTWSDNLYRIYERPLGERVTMKEAMQAFDQEHAERIRASFADLTEQKSLLDMTVPFRTAEGRERVIRITGGLEVEAGRPKRAFGVLHDITAHVTAVTQASEANRFLVLAEQIAHVGHWRLEIPSQKVTWSDEVYRIYGLEPGAGPLTDEFRNAIYHPEDRARIRAIAEQAVATGQDYEFQARIVRPDGEIRHALGRGICERDETGAVRALFGVVMDITESVRAAAEATERTRLLLLAEEIGKIGHTHVSFADERVTWSAEVYKILGRDPAEGPLPPQVIRSLYHPDDREQAERFAAGVREGRDMEFEARLVRPDGEIKIIYTRGITEKDENGVPRAYFGVVADVTERKRSEERLRESTRLLKATLDNMDQGLIMVDRDDRVQIANRRVLEMLDLPAELIARRPLQQEIRDYQIAQGEFASGGPEVANWIANALVQTDAPVYLRERPNGTVLEIRTVSLPDGGAVRTYSDVTERQRHAEELTRAKEIAEEAKARAELANQAKSEFLATMSHEIRTPLNGILGYADILMHDGLEPEQRRHVERVQSAGSALLTVVNDVLDFARIEAGEVRLERMPFSPRALVDDAVSIVHSIADRKGLAMHVTLDDALPPTLVGDEARLRQVLLNLLNNAVKFTPRGAVTLEVLKERSEPGAEVLKFYVTDTGIGIPADKQKRLFRRFSQVDGSIRREFGGTGLGLAISKELVERMGGAIGVTSTEGRGSTFFFTVTLSHGTLEEEPQAAVQDAPATLRPARILLAEDLDINQDLARSVLEAAGHTVDVVSDGSEAVAAVQAKAYDVVLMDVQMPVMDGITATRQIRALDHPAAALPIIAMTANVLPQQITAYRQAGMTDHVGKPFKRDELYAVVERAMKSGMERGFVPPTPAEVSLDEPVLDKAIIDELEGVGGAAMVERLLDQFATNYRTRFVDPDPAQIARDAHALVSSAGMLGLTRLSQACARLEKACGDGGADVTPVLAEVRSEAEAALEAASAWRRARG